MQPLLFFISVTHKDLSAYAVLCLVQLIIVFFSNVFFQRLILMQLHINYLLIQKLQHLYLQI